MRAGRLVSVLLAGSAALPATAAAGPRVDFEMRFSKPVPGVSTGVDVRLFYRKPGHPKAKPTPVREERFTFPLGMTSDPASVDACKASDLELMLEGGSACPLGSWIGAGHGDTIMTGPPSKGETPLALDAYADGNVVKLVTQPQGVPVHFVAHAIAHGRVTTVRIPRSPGGLPDGESTLRRVHNVFPPHSRGGHAFVRTPPRCPRSRVWRFEGRFTFSDGVVETDVYRMPCRRRP
jgi:hypothetical protein